MEHQVEHQAETPKKTYQAPELVVHGSVTELTGFEFEDLGLKPRERRGSMSSARGS